MQNNDMFEHFKRCRTSQYWIERLLPLKPDKYGCGLDITEIAELLAYYMMMYENAFNHVHITVSDDGLMYILSRLEDYSATDFDDFIQIVDKHFQTQLDCDYNIIHFFSGELIQNRKYECGLL